MSLTDFFKQGRLREHRTSHEDIQALLGIAERSIADASVELVVPGTSDLGGFGNLRGLGARE